MNIPKNVLSIEERQALIEEICTVKKLELVEPAENTNIEHIRVTAVITNVMNLKHQFETNGPLKEEAREKLLIIYQALAKQGDCI
jgi:hypothetical protein